MPVEELERDIYATGFFRQKTKAIRGTMQTLLEQFDGVVPRNVDELVRLPGVARKTANVVAAELGDAQGVVVDTHVRRLSQRLGLTKQEDPVKIERDLMKLVPREHWGRFPHLLIWHGRRVCIARRPLCEQCVLADLCPRAFAGLSATSRPPSASSAGKRSATTCFCRPARVCNATCCPSRRTPHSSATATGFGLGGRRSPSPRGRAGPARDSPVSSKTPLPVASTRPCWSQTTKPVFGAG